MGERLRVRQPGPPGRERPDQCYSGGMLILRSRQLRGCAHTDTHFLAPSVRPLPHARVAAAVHTAQRSSEGADDSLRHLKRWRVAYSMAASANVVKQPGFVSNTHIVPCILGMALENSIHATSLFCETVV